MNRRTCLKTIGALFLSGPLAQAATGQPKNRPKAPYKLLYNNDSTNIIFSVSPYHPKNAPFTASMLEASVDEAAGADAHLIMPGMGWVPWWPSKVLPLEEHHRWFRDTYGIEPDNSIHTYILEGGDYVQTFIDRCRLRGQAPLVSFRLNDGHTLERRDNPRPVQVMTMNKFYMDHPEYWLGPDKNNWYHKVQNWAIPEVREYKYAMIEELYENYDLDGLELDLMRHCALFNLKKTPSEERRAIMTGFVKRVRALLDRTAKPGQRRWLGVRIPCFEETHDALGIHVPSMVEAGVDMVNLSPFYFTQQTHDLAKIRAAAPDTRLYLELTHAIAKLSHSKNGHDPFIVPRNNNHMLYTSAHMTYEQGADGISLFNFVYYREHGNPERGPFNEPPFHVLPHLKDPAWLARQPQWYHLGHDWNNPKRKHVPLERTMAKGKRETFEMACAPTDLLSDGVFRLLADRKTSPKAWRVAINGKALQSCPYAHKPLDHPYEAGLERPEEYACYTCPADLIKSGLNEIALTLTGADEIIVRYMDIVLPV